MLFILCYKKFFKTKNMGSSNGYPVYFLYCCLSITRQRLILTFIPAICDVLTDGRSVFRSVGVPRDPGERARAVYSSVPSTVRDGENVGRQSPTSRYWQQVHGIEGCDGGGKKGLISKSAKHNESTLISAGQVSPEPRERDFFQLPLLPTAHSLVRQQTALLSASGDRSIIHVNFDHIPPHPSIYAHTLLFIQTHTHTHTLAHILARMWHRLLNTRRHRRHLLKLLRQILNAVSCELYNLRITFDFLKSSHPYVQTKVSHQTVLPHHWPASHSAL